MENTLILGWPEWTIIRSIVEHNIQWIFWTCWPYYDDLKQLGNYNSFWFIFEQCFPQLNVLFKDYETPLRILHKMTIKITFGLSCSSVCDKCRHTATWCWFRCHNCHVCMAMSELLSTPKFISTPELLSISKLPSGSEVYAKFVHINCSSMGFITPA
jgi:hypothetical protein